MPAKKTRRRSRKRSKTQRKWSPPSSPGGNYWEPQPSGHQLPPQHRNASAQDGDYLDSPYGGYDYAEHTNVFPSNNDYGAQGASNFSPSYDPNGWGSSSFSSSYDPSGWGTSSFSPSYDPNGWGTNSFPGYDPNGWGAGTPMQVFPEDKSPQTWPPKWSAYLPGPTGYVINSAIDSARYDYPSLEGLRKYSLEGAELHSGIRWPHPRCHPGTRANLREQIHTWLMDENREQNMLWLVGPAGVGKSALAQTIGEAAEKLGILGAAFFFSRGRKVNNSSLFVTSIAYQLAVHDIPFKNIIIDAIKQRPEILTRTQKRAQFENLIGEPFLTLNRCGGHFAKRLIIIDGLDECQGETEQLDIVRLIAAAVEDHDSLPFLWVICSRPEHHLKELFQDHAFSRICLQLELLPQEPGAQGDIERYLVDGLKRIAEKYCSQRNSGVTLSVMEDSEESSKLARAASGLFVVASSILAFVGDPVIANPASQLQIVLKVIDGSSMECDGDNFLAPIDKLYRGVLEELESYRLPKTLQLLGFCAVSPAIPGLHLANLLGFTQATFYFALRSLHAFLSVPHYTAASQEPLHFFHASFPDFLTHHTRSQIFFQDPDVRRSELTEIFFNVLNSTNVTISQKLSWRPVDADQDEDDVTASALSVSYDIMGFAATHVWETFTHISNPRPELLLKILVFDFRRLQPLSETIPVRAFIHFIRRLHALGSQVLEFTDIVRTHHLFDMDEVLLQKCATISKPLNLEDTVEVDELDGSPRYVLVGFEMKTVIILFVPEVVMVYSLDDINSL